MLLLLLLLLLFFFFCMYVVLPNMHFCFQCYTGNTALICIPLTHLLCSSISVIPALSASNSILNLASS